MIMAGGTGGHVYPALAVADYLKDKGLPVLWLGTRKGLEARVVPENGYTLLTIDVTGVRGKRLLKKLIAPFVMLCALFQALGILMKHNPGVMLGMGGFASGPGGLAAFLLRIPVCIHEQNAIAGLTNKLLSRIATVIMQAFPNTFDNSTRLYHTGNPVRNTILNIISPAERFESRTNEFNVLVIGGSLGAKKLNEIVPEALKGLCDKIDFNVRHQSGPGNIIEARQYYTDVNFSVDVVPYIEDMAEAYAWADIVICRSGAMTIAELAIVGVASILIPYPYAVDDHQSANARFLSDNASAILIPEPELTTDKLSAVISKLCSSRKTLIEMAESARKLGQSQATQNVAELCMEVAHV